MKYSESNFIYLKETKLKKYYDELVKAECAVECFPRISKIIIRRVAEDLLRTMAKECNMEIGICTSTLIENIKFNSSFSFPQEFYNEIDIIRGNENEQIYHNKINKKIPKNPIELLEIIHNIFCCYLKETEIESILKIKDLTFNVPTTIEHDRMQFKTFKEEILLKKNQIDNLRAKLIESAGKISNIHELTNIIILIREEKSKLEDIEKILINKIKRYKIELINLEENYTKYIRRFDELKKKCYENQQLLINKQDQLVKAELESQELKNLVKNLEEQDRNLMKQAKMVDEQLEEIRKSYERSLSRSSTYQDIIETIEFAYDDKIKKELELQKISVKMEVEFEDRKFNENIILYNRNLEDTKRKARIFKGILSERIRKEIKYEEFYRGFLKIEGRQLRILYAMIINNKPSQISKPKELLSKGNEESFNESLNKKLEGLKGVSDDQIRLFLYYKLIKVGNVRFEPIYNKKKFINTLDRMVEKAYGALTTEKEFRAGYNKLESIIMYYLEKVIENLKTKCNNIQTHEKLIDDIYSVVRTLNSCPTEIIHNKIDVKSAPEDVLKGLIKKDPFAFLSIIIDLAGIELYHQICSIIFEISQSIVKSHSLSSRNNELSLLRFLNGPFIMLVFISSGGTILNQKQNEKLLALIVMEILIIEFNSKHSPVDSIRYDRMVELWKLKQQKYNDIFIEKQDKEDKLNELSKRKYNVEIKYDKILRNYTELCSKYNKYNEQFKYIVLNSNNSGLLPSYRKYAELIDAKEESENSINEAKGKLGVLKSVLSPDVWKGHSNKIRIESEIIQTEKLLILEAKDSPYFQKEQQVFFDLKKQIDETKKLMHEEKQNLEEESEPIGKLKDKINELKTQLNIIKGIYVDMEEGY